MATTNINERVRELIWAIRDAEKEGSVTNVMVAEALMELSNYLSGKRELLQQVIDDPDLAASSQAVKKFIEGLIESEVSDSTTKVPSSKAVSDAIKGTISSEITDDEDKAPSCKAVNDKLGGVGLVFPLVDVKEKAQMYDNKYTIFSSGAWTTAGAGNKIFGFILTPEDSEYLAIRVYTAANDSVPAAIAFYNTETPTGNGYMSESSVQIADRNPQWYEAIIPEGTKCITVMCSELRIPKEDVRIEVVRNITSKPIEENEEGDEILVHEYTSSVVDTAVSSPSFNLATFPIGTQFKIELTDAVQDVKVFISSATSGGNLMEYALLKKGETYYFEKSSQNNILALRSEKVDNNIISYKLYTVKTFPVEKRGLVPYVRSQKKINFGNLFNGYWNFSPDEKYNTADWVCGQIQYTNGFKLRINTDYSKWYVAIKIWERDMTSYEEKAMSEGFVLNLSDTYAWHLQVRRQDRAKITPEDAREVFDGVEIVEGIVYSKPFTHRDFIEGTAALKEELKGDVNGLVREGLSKNANIPNPFLLAPHYYHFAANGFIKDKEKRNILASESIEDVEMAARLGFPFIEANVQATAEGNFVCIHGESGKFGPEVKSLDGQDAKTMVIKDKTVDYIKKNLRYDSADERYCTTIPTLEEFCKACRKNNIGIFAGLGTSNNHKKAFEICREYLGDNIIIYGPPSNVRDYFNGYVFVWCNGSDYTVESLIEDGKKYGAPYMCGIGPTTYSKLKEEGKLEELVKRMHEEGFLVGVAAVYQTENEVREAFELGFDYTGSGHQVNPFSHNYEIYDLDDPNAQFEGATPQEGIITLRSGEILTCGSDDVIALGKGQLDIKYTGTIKVDFGSSKGSRSATTSEDIENLVTYTDYYFRNDTKLTITAQSEVKIKYLVYKTSKC